MGLAACNLIVIGRRSLVNASRHLRQTTHVGPLHNARDRGEASTSNRWGGSSTYSEIPRLHRAL